MQEKETDEKAETPTAVWKSIGKEIRAAREVLPQGSRDKRVFRVLVNLTLQKVEN